MARTQLITIGLALVVIVATSGCMPDITAKDPEDTSTLESLPCPPDSHLGPTWNDLTIGESTRNDIERELSPANIYRDHDRVRITNESEIQDFAWSVVYVCYQRDKLTAMRVVGSRELSKSLDEWLNKYGSPDRITWSDGYYYRSVIWAEYGVLASVRTDGVITGEVIFFPPMDKSLLETSWLIDALPKTLLGKPGDSGLEPSDEENPWSVEGKKLPKEDSDSG
jgi:hypothetical protein